MEFLSNFFSSIVYFPLVGFYFEHESLRLLFCFSKNYFLLCFTIAATKLTKIGCGLGTVLLYSGWYCTPIKNGWSLISTISTKPVSGLIPELIKPAFSSFSAYLLLYS